MSGNKRKRDISPSLSSDSKENDFDEDDHGLLGPSRGNDSDDSMDIDVGSSIGETSFFNSGDRANYTECGIVKSLKLINFMCHGHFSIDFGPRINFVIGRNGSGKSAILTAIVLALGGRSTHTSRGQSLKSFIKTGETRAKIVVKLNNYNGISTSSSYKYDEYGDTIWVERLIKADGSSVYVLRNKKGVQVSNKKAELDAIVRRFNIQIDNPIVVLNQEVSRNFLNSKNPRDKYNFFMKATQLEDILNDYAYAAEKTSLTALELDKKKAILKAVAAELVELKKKVKLLEKIDEHNNKLAFLDDELLWAMVREKEREYELVKKEIESHESKVEDAGISIEKYEKKLEKFSNDRDEVNNGLESTGVRFNELKVKIEEEAQVMTELKENKNRLLIERNKIRTELNDNGKDEKELINKITELQKKYGDVDQAEKERQQRAESLIKLEEEDGTLKSELRTAKLHRDQLYGSIAEMEKRLSGCRSEIDSIKVSINRKRSDIQQARNSEKDKLLRFGPNMPYLLKQIDIAHRAGQFIKKPLGPIGSLIKLREPAAALAVESCIKGLVNAFCCDNQEDANVLSQIFARNLRNQRTPMIITRKFTQLHDVSVNCVQSDRYHSILQLLEIEQPAVANVLIDRANIECIVYIANESEALDIMTNVDKVPRNCNQAYTKQGTNMYPIRRNQFFKSYAPALNQAKYLSSDLTAYIDSLEQEVDELQHKFDNKSKELAPLEQNLSENKADYEATCRRVKSMTERLGEVARELEELKNTVESAPVEISVFEMELSTVRAEMAIRSEKLKSTSEKFDQATKAIDELAAKIATLQEEKNNLFTQERPMRERLRALDDKIRSIERNLEHFRATLATFKTELEELKLNDREMHQEVEEIRTKALEKTEKEIRTSRSPTEVKKEISDIKIFMQEQEKEIGDRDKILKQFNDRIKAHENCLEQVQTVEGLLEEFKTATTMRLEKYRRLRKQITDKACQVFKLALDALNFAGTLDVYHDESIVDGATKKAKTLEIKINPKVMVNSDVYKDTRSLSGGERSYGTVAFLVALWESCNSPFRILDEVDVFMDVVTRCTAMQILVENAKMKHGKQYIFLSPLGLAVDEKYVHVHRMPDPVRGITHRPSED